MAAGAAFPGIFFCFAATVLLIFASVSAPTWNRIAFQDAYKGTQSIHFGVFGTSVSDSTHVGWNFSSDVLGYNPSNLNSGTVHHLTYSLILVPITAGIAGLATIFGLIGASYHRVGTILMTLLAALGALVGLVAWVLAMVLFGAYSRSSLRDNGWSVYYGKAMWLVLAAWFSLAIGFCVSALGSFGRYRRKRTPETNYAAY